MPVRERTDRYGTIRGKKWNTDTMASRARLASLARISHSRMSNVARLARKRGPPGLQGREFRTDPQADVSTFRLSVHTLYWRKRRLDRRRGRPGGPRYVSGTKAAFELMGMPMGPPRAPRLPLPDAQRPALREVLRQMGVLADEKVRARA